MKQIKFTKMQARGNDFIIIENRVQSTEYKKQNLSKLAVRLCDRRFGIGADGLLVLEKSCIADVKMRIFNVDGSEAEMCGNGASCVALYSSRNQKPVTRNQINIETKAGIIEAKVRDSEVRIRLTDPKDIKLDISIKINSRILKVNFVDTGVPHAVVFVEGVEKIDAGAIGKAVRYHKAFSPKGTNVNFIEVLNKDSIKIRTYERGVEDETLACGTGAVASTLIFALKNKIEGKVKVHTKSGEALTVYFKKSGNNFKDVWLEGKAGIVFEGKFIMDEKSKHQT